ncbi:DUF2069 domain-containing protein [Methylophilaceae bacterium]|jgi:uncharacterized membrane protein|nr:DUF2069 domain-containing protein [Methylophilaceae bacterium]|tara:strand:+ start:1200 stop:1535 length:336 start_codon:yes stop_codon:yes gene_type:complete
MNILFIASSSSLIGLIILNLFWEIFYNPLHDEASLMVIKSVILLIPLSGILKKNRYTYQWSSMFILLFFIEGVVRFYSESEVSKSMALYQIILTCIFFLSTVFFCKVTKKL